MVIMNGVYVIYGPIVNLYFSCYNLPELIICMPKQELLANYREFAFSPSLWEIVWRENATLSPETLREAFPSYCQFSPIQEQPLILSKTGLITLLDQPVIIGIYGPTSSGKDTLVRRITVPHERFVTTTSRPKRPGQTDGREYYFVSAENFLKQKEKGAFLEQMEESGGFYGTTKIEVEEKMKKARMENIPLLLWRANVQGHRTFAPKVLEAHGIIVPGVFLIPHMPVQAYFEHIQKVRGEREVWKRWDTARAEIEHAPEIVDYLLVNPFDEEHGQQMAVNAFNYLLSRLYSLCS